MSQRLNVHSYRQFKMPHYQLFIRPLVAVVAIFSANVCQAASVLPHEICHEANTLIQHAEQNFETIELDGQMPILTGASECALSTTLTGARAFHCMWSYDYRDGAAKQRFDEYISALDYCWGNETRAADETNVNHPDSYSLVSFILPKAGVAISLKDKATLRQTYIFLRVSALSAP